MDNTIVIYPTWSQHKLKHVLKDDYTSINLPKSMIIDTLSVVNNKGELISYYIEKGTDSDLVPGELVRVWIKSINAKPLDMIYIKDNTFYSNTDQTYFKFASSGSIDGISAISWQGKYESINPILKISIPPDIEEYNKNITINYLLKDLYWRSYYIGIIQESDNLRNLKLILKGTIHNNTEEIINVVNLKLANGDIKPPVQEMIMAAKMTRDVKQRSQSQESSESETLVLEELEFFDTKIKQIPKGQISLSLKEFNFSIEKLYVYELSHNYLNNSSLKWFDKQKAKVIYRFTTNEKMIAGNLNLYLKSNDNDMIYISNSNIPRTGIQDLVDIQLSTSPVEVTTEYSWNDVKINTGNDSSKTKLSRQIHTKITIRNNLNSKIRMALQDHLNNIKSINPQATRKKGNLYEWQFDIGPKQMIETNFKVDLLINNETHIY